MGHLTPNLIQISRRYSMQQDYIKVHYSYNKAFWERGRKVPRRAPKCADKANWCPGYLGRVTGLVLDGAQKFMVRIVL